jgi:hypothetical protein
VFRGSANMKNNGVQFGGFKDDPARAKRKSWTSA